MVGLDLAAPLGRPTLPPVASEAAASLVGSLDVGVIGLIRTVERWRLCTSRPERPR